ncbi:MAG: class I SAM-dependent methyltransferase [Nocardioidaceae bacterium]
MNKSHAALCSSSTWGRHIADVVLPETLLDVVIVRNVLEIGPGYGAATSRLSQLTNCLTAIELDEAMAADLTRKFPSVAVVPGSGANMPFTAGRFDAVVCFTMLHHVSSTSAQDALFAEARRVLAPGGVFAGSDSVASPGLRKFHGADTYVPVDPDMLPRRLAEAGFLDIQVRVTAPGERFAFSARTHPSTMHHVDQNGNRHEASAIHATTRAPGGAAAEPR